MTKIPIKPENSRFNDEQWEAIHQDGSNILVAASAGSGKTAVLIERIMTKLIYQGYSIEDFLVVTFTEAAAREMKERMSARLKTAVNETLDPVEQQGLTKQNQLLSQANIRTLHSFCLRVVETFYYLTDFEANFQLVTDETRLLLLYQEAWQNLIEKIMVPNGSVLPNLSQEDYLKLVKIHGNSRSDQNLFDRVLTIYRFAMAQKDPQSWLDQADQTQAQSDNFLESDLFKQNFLPVLRENLQAGRMYLEEALHLIAGGSHPLIERYQPLLENELNQVNQLLEALLADTAAVGLINQIQTLTYDTWPRVVKAVSEEKDLVDEAKSLREQAKNLIKKQVQTLFPYPVADQMKVEVMNRPPLSKLMILCQNFITELNELKQSQNLIDYNDLEHLTLDILAPIDPETKERKPSLAALTYQATFKEILVDEYQDINEIQAEILAWLAHDYRPDLTHNQFMVGDVKQSIYGFRMAEPQLFLNKYLSYQEVTNPEQLVILNKNYRSRHDLLQFTNFIFERIMDLNFGQMNYQTAERLVTANPSFIEADEGEIQLKLLLNVKTDSEEEEAEEVDQADETLELGVMDGPVFDAAVEAEIALVIADIKARVQVGELIYDKSKEIKKANGQITYAKRPVTYKDFVILSATRGPFAAAVNQFQEAEIPLKAQKVEHYFQRFEIQLVLALLQVIDNPYQDIPFAAILKSYFVGLTDEDLAQIRIYQPQGSFYAAFLQLVHDDQVNDEPLKHIKNKGLSFLVNYKNWVHLSKTLPLEDLIWTIYLDSQYLNYVALLTNGKQRMANLRALTSRAQDFYKLGYSGLANFVYYIQQIIKEEKDLAEPLVLDQDENFVRIMTVHASKGLEYPIVYLLNTGKQFNLSDGKSRVLLSKQYGIASDYYDLNSMQQFPSLIKKAFQLETIERLKAEEMRKLYVALTRCEQKLVIVGSIANERKWQQKIAEIRTMTPSDQLVAASAYRRGAKSWLDWIQIALAVADSQHENYSDDFSLDRLMIEFKHQEDLVQTGYELNMAESAHQSFNPLSWIDSQIANIESEPSILSTNQSQALDFDYPHQLASRTSSYQSVSELKRLYEEPDNLSLSYYRDRRPQASKAGQDQIQGIRYTQDSFKSPSFIESESTISATEIGSLTHLYLQLLPWQALEVESADSSMQLKYVIDQMEGDYQLRKLPDSQIESIMWFIQSDLAQQLRMRQEQIKKEQAFSLLLPAKKMFAGQFDQLDIQSLDQEQLLIHGVVDLYIELADQIILIDYKTNRFRDLAAYSRQEQIDRLKDGYKFQFSIYRHALQLAKHKPVTAAYMVLLDFKEIVKMDDFYSFA
ncbi:helicase-exonuclease AddAB subunit AddA [Eremococcus coleocola]|uniref:DNA 3'-5' helicase n=1 Tax=Eremococcus coleocola ACS-139-V-Col8 TaxID=908337 RepID=E4KLT3_9LACT|nr:helicase-exonuclease AddAB subunit AddA [Eremococcus coleocola]EFR31977.1 ATP-dependent nuclease subunit A [Eremococcus coleocola ACS-139-V-Col8]